MIQPVSVNDSDILGWSDRPSIVVSTANWWARSMKRGRGAVPRALSRLLSKNHRQTLVTQHGAQLAMAPRALDVYAAMRRKGGCWEPQIFAVCRSLLKPGNVFFDVGANVGYMTIEMSTAFHGKVSCIAFEPQPDLARCIVISAHLNGVADVVKVYDVMVGDADRNATLQLTSHSLHASALAREEKATSLERQMTSIDAMVNSGLVPPPDVIKIDVEGGELQAFRGAEAVIREHRPDIVFEADANLKRFGYARDDLFQQLSSLADFEYFDISSDASLHPISEQHPGYDVLARSASRAR